MTPGTLGAYLSTATLLFIGAVSLLPVACSSSTATTKAEKQCTPGAYVFCRCQDREEGTKLCKDDAQSFGPCEPCESPTNPEGPIQPGDPTPSEPVQKDGGPITTTQDSGPTTGGCGDGIAQDGEDCDDKNADPNDGCNSTTCKLSGTAPPASNACPGLEVHVWGGTHKPTLVSTTVGSGNHSVKTTCGSATGDVPTSGAAGTDRVFKVIAHKTGMMQVFTSDTDFNNFLYVSTTCPTDQVEWITCANKVDGPAGETISFGVDAGTTYYVFVDGANISNNAGTFRVTFAIQ